LGSFGLNIGEIRRSRRRFAGACIDWNPNPGRREHLNGVLAAGALRLDLVGSCRSCEKS